MKLSNAFFYTIREDIKDEESVSGNLLVRSGMIRKVSSGIYMYMPLGLKVLNNIEAIIRDEMNKIGSLELLMPSLLPEEVYIASGRRANFGNSMFSLKDRFNRNYVLGPTHEELFVEAAKQKIKSYKDMPFSLYQIANKYRDEPRPRFGLIRVREFAMKDAYTFDTDLNGLDKSYNLMYNAYKNIFNRLGIDYRIVTADTGVMGGLLSEEFQAITDIGEDTLVLCSKCNYASNIEVSVCTLNSDPKEEELAKELVHTPNVKTISEVANFLNVNEHKLVKSLVYKANDKFYLALVAGDRELNELKLAKLLKVNEVVLASFEEVEMLTKASVGFAGPIGLDLPVIADIDILGMYNFVVGANQTDYHYKNVNINDFKVSMSGDIKNVKELDKCPVCGNTLTFKKGIEIGNTFKLGTKYSEALDLYYTDEANKLVPVMMGCHGIGIGRILAAIVEQTSDSRGLNLPIAIAPYKVGIVLLNEEATSYANALYDELNKLGIDTLLDDRLERAGVKFNDMDLIGLPIRITIGKKFNEGYLELKLRKADEAKEISKEEVINKIKELVI